MGRRCEVWEVWEVWAYRRASRTSVANAGTRELRVEIKPFSKSTSVRGYANTWQCERAVAGPLMPFPRKLVLVSVRLKMTRRSATTTKNASLGSKGDTVYLFNSHQRACSLSFGPHER